VWVPAVEAAGLSPLRFHDLRHSAASLMIAQNVHPKVIQSRLGHSSITVTMDTYGHLLPSLDQEVAEGLEVIYQKAKIQTASAHLVHDLQDVNLDQ
jgi:integrase